MKILHKLLFRQVNAAQSAGFFVFSLFGMTIVLLGIQFYFDVRPFVSKENNLLNGDYLIVTRQPATAPSVGQTVFTDDEIEELARQPFVRNIGIFRPSLFSVSAGLGLKRSGLYFSTEMFFESVPDRYVDSGLEKWNYDGDSPNIPIIIPRNYLDLYNFGFAPARNLPRLTEEMIGLLALEITLEGNGATERYTGNIVGFSDRLNTILVPEKFMRTANERLAPGMDSRPSRLIVEVTNPADKHIPAFLDQKGYTVQNDKDRIKTSHFLRLAIGLIAGVGAIICLLSFYLLVLSIYLILQKNSSKLRTLLLTGYSAEQLARPYQMFVLRLNGCVGIGAVTLTVTARLFYLKQIGMLREETPDTGVLPAVGAGIVLFILLSVLHSVMIRRKIVRIGDSKN